MKFGGLKVGVVEVSVVVDDDVVVTSFVRGSQCCIHLVLSLPSENNDILLRNLLPSHPPLLLSNFTSTPISRQLPSH